MDTDDDSFIILSASPPPNVVFDFSRIPATFEPNLNASLHELMDKVNHESSIDARISVIDNGPSQSSLMVASTILSEKTPKELETSVGEIIEENTLLKETLKKNNDSLREQFLLIASCQEDMIKTHQLHKEKFTETKELVDRLRQENKTLKQEMMNLLDGSIPQNTFHETTTQSVNNSVTSANNLADSPEKITDPNVKLVNLVDKSTEVDGLSTNVNGKSTDVNGKSTDVDGKSGFRSNASSMMEFVTSPDDDVINKLTAQLELVEKQRRQVIIDNDKLTWQKESLERVVDATSTERDQLQMDIANLKENISKKESEHLIEITRLTTKIHKLENLLKERENMVSAEELRTKNVAIQQYEVKVATLQNELKRAQLKVLESENIKSELANQKAAALEASNLHKQQILQLHSRLKDVQTVMFQPLRCSLSQEVEDASNAEYANFMANVKLYDRTLKQIAELLNAMSNSSSESLVKGFASELSLVEPTSTNTFINSDFKELMESLDEQNKNGLNYMGQIKGAIAVFEGIFNDYRDLLRTTLDNQRQATQTTNVDVEPLTSALLARAAELKAAQSEIADLRRLIVALREEKDEKELLRAQMDVYKTDFLCEREAREKLACEKETVAAELRGALKKKQELTEYLEEVRKLNPNIHKSATTKKCKPRTLTSTRLTPPEGPARTAAAPSTTTTGNMVYTCPKCTLFSSDQYRVMEDHFDICLNDF